MKTGLVMEGGAMRGMFTAGVIDVMMENEIVFDGAIGVSAGATFGCNYVSHQPGRAIRYNMDYCKDWRYCSVRSLIRTGDMFGAEFCYYTIPDKLDPFDVDTFYASPTEFYVVCTDIETGKPVYHKCDNGMQEDMEWIRASASMPLASGIVRAGEREMLDGGVADSIPLRYFETIGYERNVVILTQPRGFVKKKNELLPLIKVVYRKYPKFVKAVAERHEIYNKTTRYIQMQERKGSTYVICPEEKLPIGHIERDPENLKCVYEIGRSVASKHLDELRSFMGAREAVGK